MKIRDSGMPEEGIWDRFFDPTDALRRLGLRPGVENVVDVGCGYGTFTVAAARLTGGSIHAFDIDPEMISATINRAKRSSVHNVTAIGRDFMTEGSGLPDESMDYVMLFNIIHTDDPMVLLHEAFRILRRGGTTAVMHWIYDARTPRGPPLSIRPRPGQCVEWLKAARFEVNPELIDLAPYHFGLTAIKR